MEHYEGIFIYFSLVMQQAEKQFIFILWEFFMKQKFFY